MGIWLCLLIRKEIGLRCIRYRKCEKGGKAFCSFRLRSTTGAFWAYHWAGNNCCFGFAQQQLFLDIAKSLIHVIIELSRNERHANLWYGKGNEISGLTIQNSHFTTHKNYSHTKHTPLTFSRSHVLTFLRSHVLTFSRSYVLMLSRSHVLTFLRSYALTLSLPPYPFYYLSSIKHIILTLDAADAPCFYFG